jgi:hypothetical protein
VIKPTNALAVLAWKLAAVALPLISTEVMVGDIAPALPPMAKNLRAEAGPAIDESAPAPMSRLRVSPRRFIMIHHGALVCAHLPFCQIHQLPAAVKA